MDRLYRGKVVDRGNYYFRTTPYPYCVITDLSPHPDELARASVSKDEARKQATWPSWFETAQGRLLTMRVL